MAEDATPNEVAFADLGLNDAILRAVSDSGYTIPTEIQRRAIPEILARRNVVGVAQTGTGKTASFTLPMLNLLASGRARARMPRSLILSPTRELAGQTSSNFEKYGKYLNLSMVLIIGGVGMGDQEKALEKGVDVLIATPGRLLDWFERGKLLLGGVDILVIDEADRMLDMGFLPDIERILSLLLARKQTLLFSATMPPEISRLTERFMTDALKIEVSRPATSSASIADVVVPVKSSDKRGLLSKLIGAQDIQKAIIFCNRKRDVGSLTRHLQKRGMNARDLHGDLDQAHRQATLEAFKGGEVDFLVATDVAARGLDISDMPVVVNFDVPMNADDYVHRIGRTGRAGKLGRAFTLSTPADRRYLDAIEKNTGRSIDLLDVDEEDDTTTVAVEAEAEAPSHRAGDGMQIPFLRAPRSRRKAPGTRTRGRRKVQNDALDLADEPVSEAAEAPRSDEVEAEASTVEKPARQRRTRRSRGGKQAESESVQAPKEAAPQEVADKSAKSDDDRTAARKSSRRKPSKKEADEPVVGLGDHVPSFLLRPVPVKSSTTAELE